MSEKMERPEDLYERVLQFLTLQLPGQPQMMHHGEDGGE